MNRYIIGIIFIAIGVVMIIFSEKLLQTFGRIRWAEQHLGMEGGTRLFYKLLGMAVILFAFMLMSGRIFTILDAIFLRN